MLATTACGCILQRDNLPRGKWFQDTGDQAVALPSLPDDGSSSNLRLSRSHEHSRQAALR
jgi:hypothetical protein